MGLEEKNKTILEREDRMQNMLYKGVFFVLFFLIIMQILLLALGIGSPCCIGFLIILLLLIILFFWHMKRIDRIKREKLARQSRTNLEVINIPKIYDFYCPRCLYQTNEDVEYCPNCEIGVLSPTTKNIN